jgi:hypothetical protein
MWYGLNKLAAFGEVIDIEANAAFSVSAKVQPSS